MVNFWLILTERARRSQDLTDWALGVFTCMKKRRIACRVALDAIGATLAGYLLRCMSGPKHSCPRTYTQFHKPPFTACISSLGP